MPTCFHKATLYADQLVAVRARLAHQRKFSPQHWCCFIDFSRVFDSIVISKLLFKLERYGVSGLLLKWISCFLQGRTQCVVVEGCFSSLVSIVSGVPQGSVLGPLLFLLFINDKESVCDGKSTLQLYADDVKLYSSVDLHDHPNSLQLPLDRLSAWADQWQLTINISKMFSSSLYFYNPSDFLHLLYQRYSNTY